MWYDVNDTLSHNCLFNFIVGPRGVGKTFAAKEKAIKNFLRKGEQFVYLRRFETELEAVNLEKFFDDISFKFPDQVFTVKNRQFYIDGHLAGFAIPLSKAAQYKSVPFPLVSLIIFDEFIIDQGMIRYLPNEVVSFNELYSTIARMRDVIVLFLSNAITFTNPYFLFYDLKLQQNQKIMKRGDILLQMVDSPVYMDQMANTRFGRIIANTSYGKYAINNEFLRDNEEFVKKIDEPGIPIFNLKAGGLTFTVYRYMSNDYWMVSEKKDDTLKRNISLDLSSHTVGTTMTGDTATNIWWQNLKHKFFRAEVVFSSVKAKNVIMPYLKTL